MNHAAALQRPPIHAWPSKLLTAVIVALGIALLSLDGLVAASLTQTSAGFWRAAAIAYLIAAVGIPVVVVRLSLRSQGSRGAATRRAALVSIAMNVTVLPLAVAVLAL